MDFDLKLKEDMFYFESDLSLFGYKSVNVDTCILFYRNCV